MYTIRNLLFLYVIMAIVVPRYNLSAQAISNKYRIKSEDEFRVAPKGSLFVVNQEKTGKLSKKSKVHLIQDSLNFYTVFDVSKIYLSQGTYQISLNSKNTMFPLIKLFDSKKQEVNAEILEYALTKKGVQSEWRLVINNSGEYAATVYSDNRPLSQKIQKKAVTVLMIGLIPVPLPHKVRLRKTPYGKYTIKIKPHRIKNLIDY